MHARSFIDARQGLRLRGRREMASRHCHTMMIKKLAGALVPAKSVRERAEGYARPEALGGKQPFGGPKLTPR
jgi:hypothetical protein